MDSAWLIRCKDGCRAIMTEKVYAEIYQKRAPKENVEVEEHWFSMEDCIKNNPDVRVLD